MTEAGRTQAGLTPLDRSLRWAAVVGLLGASAAWLGCSSSAAGSNDLCADGACENGDDGATSTRRDSGSLPTDPTAPDKQADAGGNEDAGADEDASTEGCALATCCTQLESCCEALTTHHGICLGIVSTRLAGLCQEAFPTCREGDPADDLEQLVTSVNPCVELGRCCDTKRAEGEPVDVCEGVVMEGETDDCATAYQGYKDFGPCL